ncbi:MAG: sulfatase [Synoicihabitans sp.]
MTNLRLILTVLASLVALVTSSIAATASRPNIVFVITDDQRWDGLSINGHPAAQTPHIDRLGHEGLSLDNFLVSTPLCSPSRATFLTGRYARKHNIINNDKLGLDVISHTLMTFPRRLREAGYETGFVGKWHMGLDDSRRPGFDTWISFKGQGIYIDGVINHNGERRQLTGYMTDFINQWSVEFLEQPRDKPFCLYVSHKAVHAPFLPAPRHNDLYADFHPELPHVSAANLAGKPMLTRDVTRPPMYTHEGVAPEPPEPHRGRDRTPAGIMRDQIRSIAAVDEGVGQLYATLERLGELDNTVFIYTSDNGFLLGEHGKFNTKRWAYEPNLRVPFLVRYPPLVPAGSRSTALVGAVDVAPTLLELAGVESVVEMHGESFVPLLADPTAKGRDELLAEYFYEKVTPQAPAWQAIRTPRWKYIQYDSPDATPAHDELYDLANDPQETNNLIADPAHRDQLGSLRSRLARMIADAR